MLSPSLKYNTKALLRREYFNPDVLQAALTAFGLVVPLTVAYLVNQPLVGSIGAITAQVLLSAKIQTIYPQRALILFLGLIFISSCVLMGTLVTGNIWLSILAMALIAGASSVAKEIGSHGQHIGFCAVLVFLIALSPPHSLEIGLARYLAVWLGGLWATLLFLFFWPFRPDLPYYTTLARPWELSGDMAAFLVITTGKADLAEQVQEKEISLRHAINDVLPYLRLNNNRYFYIRRDLLKIVRASSRFGATIMAMNHALEHLRDQETGYKFIPAVKQRLVLASEVAKGIANALVLDRPKDAKELDTRLQRLKNGITELQHLNNVHQSDFPAQLDLHRIITLMQSATRYLDDAHLLLTRLNQKKHLPPATPVDQPIIPHKVPPLKKLFRFKNVSRRHTLRLMLITALGVGLYLGFQIPRGYWIALTVMVVLQPDYGTTQQKAWQRVTGTFIGGILGTVLLIHTFPAAFFILAVAILSFLYNYYQQRNYTVSVIFLTMMMVALFEIAGPVDWHIAANRLLSTVLGVILSVAAAFLLWPEWERTKVRAVMAQAFRANRHLLTQLHHELVAQTGFHARIIASRRKAEIANLTVADSVTRLKLEPGTKKQKLKVARSIAYYNGRLTRELTSLAALLPQIKTSSNTYPEAEAFLQEALTLLAAITDAMLTEKTLAVPVPESLPFPNQTNPFAASKNFTPEPDAPVSTQVLHHELIHEQINKIADAIYNLGKSVQLLNEL